MVVGSGKHVQTSIVDPGNSVMMASSTLNTELLTQIHNSIISIVGWCSICDDPCPKLLPISKSPHFTLLYSTCGKRLQPVTFGAYHCQWCLWLGSWQSCSLWFAASIIQIHYCQQSIRENVGELHLYNAIQTCTQGVERGVTISWVVKYGYMWYKVVKLQINRPVLNTPKF